MKKDNNKKNPAESNKSKINMPSVSLTKKQKVWIGIASIVLVILLLTLLIFWLNSLFFEDNKHFTLSAVRIDTVGKSAGYWNNPQTIDSRSADLTREMELEPGKDNLFAQDWEKKRADLRKGHPEMADIQLIPVLPDLLQIRITERLPVARLEQTVKANTLLLDKDRFLFAAKYYSAARSLPYISDETRLEKLVPGEQAEGDGIKFLLEFINLIQGNEFQFQVVSARLIDDQSGDNYGKCIKAHLKWGYFDCRNVFIPFPQDGAAERLKENFRVLKSYAAQNPKVVIEKLCATKEKVEARK